MTRGKAKGLVFRDLADRLLREGRAGEGHIEALRRSLDDRDDERHVPVVLKILSGFGAFLAAAFFCAFLVAAKIFSGKTPLSVCVAGLVFIAFALALDNLHKKVSGLAAVFWLHSAFLAMAIGKGLAVYAVFVAFDLKRDTLLFAALALGVLTCATYAFFKDSAERFLSAWGAGLLAVAWYADRGETWMAGLFISGTVLGLWAVFARDLSAREHNGLGYACALTLLGFLLLYFPQANVGGGLWPGAGGALAWASAQGLLLISLVWLYVRLAGGWKKGTGGSLSAAIMGAALVGVITVPGVLAAVGLLVLAHARRDRLLTAISCLFLVAYVSRYYYQLEASLFAKSLILMASGAVLLVGAAAVRFLLPKEAA